MDLTGAEEARDRIAAELGRDVLSISAVTGRGIPVLLNAIRERLKDRPEVDVAGGPPPPAEAEGERVSAEASPAEGRPAPGE
jgi:GTP-binding protein